MKVKGRLRAAGASHRRLITDLAARPIVTFFMAMISLALTVTVAVGAWFFHLQDVNREKDRAQANAQVAQAIRTPICYLVYSYVHPAPDSPVNVRSVQIEIAWASLGRLEQCPEGIEPPASSIPGVMPSAITPG